MLNAKLRHTNKIAEEEEPDKVEPFYFKKNLSKIQNTANQIRKKSILYIEEIDKTHDHMVNLGVKYNA